MMTEFRTRLMASVAVPGPDPVERAKMAAVVDAAAMAIEHEGAACRSEGVATKGTPSIGHRPEVGAGPATLH